MAHESDELQTHWEDVYRAKSPQAVSWYRPHLDVSVELLMEAGMSATSRVIDVGGGASTLVDDLLDRGLSDVSVIDLSEQALAIAQRRLGDRAQRVKWRTVLAGT
jgi:2-polyprenyl-3-methyl-5-hydroxy-6-metoxy-1,4-benzoquinol methylase